MQLLSAGGFAALMGYSGQQQRFTLQARPGTEGSNLPTAATCFNTLRLPANYGANLPWFPKVWLGLFSVSLVRSTH